MTSSERAGHVDELADSGSVARIRLLTSGSLSHAALASGGVLPGICLVQITDEFRLSDAQCGVFFAVAPTVSLVTLPMFGLLAERWGKRGLLAAGLALLACAMASYAAATDYSFMLVGSVFLGISSSIIDALVSPLVVDVYVPILMGSCTICAVGLVGLGFATTAGGSVIWLALLGLALSGVWPTLLILAGATIQASTPTLFSLLAMAGLVGVSICNWGVGQLADAYGLQAGLAALVVASIVALAALGIADGKQ